MAESTEQMAQIGSPPLRKPLERDRVPVLPPGAPFLLQALNDDSLSFFEIARAIERVPTVAGRLLSLANSAWSSPASPITSIENACSRLGLSVVRTAGIALVVSQPFTPHRCPPFNAVLFWEAALLRAEACGWLAGQLAYDQVSPARTGGLLSNLGLLWLAETLPDETAAALAALATDKPGQLNAALVETCGMGYDEAGALLADAWKLPPILRDAIANQVSPAADASQLSLIVHSATQMVGVLRREQPFDQAIDALVHLGMQPDRQAEGFEQLVKTRERTREMAAALFPSH